jgi:hypothetical protein
MYVCVRGVGKVVYVCVRGVERVNENKETPHFRNSSKFHSEIPRNRGNIYTSNTHIHVCPHTPSPHIHVRYLCVRDVGTDMYVCVRGVGTDMHVCVRGVEIDSDMWSIRVETGMFA